MALTKKEKLENELLELDRETRKLELDKLRFETDQAEAAALTAKIELKELKQATIYDEQAREKLHIRKQTRIAKIQGVVTDRMAEYLRSDFLNWEVEDKVEHKKPVPVTLLINSPGGYVIPGLDMFDLIMEYRDKGWTINTKVAGTAMSMAGVLLQAGETRTMTPRSTFMLHEVASYAEGKTSDIEDQLEFTKALQLHCSSVLAERSHLTVDEVDQLWKRRDIFLTAEQTLEKGFIDRIAL